MAAVSIDVDAAAAALERAKTFLRRPVVQTLSPTIAGALMVTVLALANPDSAVFAHLTGPVASTRGLLAGIFALIAAATGAFELFAWRRRVRSLCSPGAGSPLRRSTNWSPYPGWVRSARQSQIGIAKVQGWALAAGTVWLFAGTGATLEAMMLVGVCSLTGMLVSAFILFGGTFHDDVQAREADHAAARIPLKNLPAHLALGPGSQVLLSRLGVAPGSPQAEAVRALVRPGENRLLVDLVAAVQAATLPGAD